MAQYLSSLVFMGSPANAYVQSIACIVEAPYGFQACSVDSYLWPIAVSGQLGPRGLSSYNAVCVQSSVCLVVAPYMVQQFSLQASTWYPQMIWWIAQRDPSQALWWAHHMEAKQFSWFTPQSTDRRSVLWPPLRYSCVFVEGMCHYVCVCVCVFILRFCIS